MTYLQINNRNVLKKRDVDRFFKDPILFAGGDTNVFGYVANDPINAIDPLGLSSIIFGRPWWMVRIPRVRLPRVRVPRLGSPRPSANQPRPPGWNRSWQWRYGERTNPNAGRRWFDPNGGEWRWHAADRYHPEGHWDYNPWNQWNSPWQNVQSGGTSPVATPGGGSGSCNQNNETEYYSEECFNSGLCA